MIANQLTRPVGYAGVKEEMSLDVRLDPKVKNKTTCHCCGSEIDDDRSHYSASYTHNVVKMADEAGLYGVVWRPEENGIAAAGQLIEPLEKGVALMKGDPERFQRFNPSNGWGDYDSFVKWLDELLYYCKEYPDALYFASR